MLAQCVKFHQFGNPQDVLRMEHARIQPPEQGEVLVRMLTRPINPSDLIPIRGAYAHRISLPCVPGYEGVGVVIDTGASADRSLIGRRVLPLRGEGTWQQYVRAPAALAVSIPDGIDDDTAAQLYINPVTAWVICAEELGLGPEHTLLVNAGSSAVGSVLAQLANVFGYRMIAVSRSRSTTADLRQLGASSVIHPEEESVYEAVMALTDGRGADAAIDMIGGRDGYELARCVRSDGSFLSIGLLSGVQLDWGAIDQLRVRARLFLLRHWNGRTSTESWRHIFQQIITLVERGQLRLKSPDAHYGLPEVKAAVRAAETSDTSRGKVFLTS